MMSVWDMDDLNYLDEEHIKTHKEILSLFKELDNIEYNQEHPQSSEEIPFEDETHQRPQDEFIDVSPPDDDLKDEMRPPEPETLKKKEFQLLKKQKRKKVPKALIETNKKFLFTRKQRKRVPKAVITHQKHLSRQQKSLRTVSSTFTLHIDTEGNLIGFTNLKTLTKHGKEPGRLSRILRRKKPLPTAGTESPAPPKGFVGKIKNILPFGKKHKEESSPESSDEPSKKNKLKSLISLRRKSKEST